MKRSLVAVIGCVLALGAALAGEVGENLVRNGDLETAEPKNAKQPQSWSLVDNITTFWEAGKGNPGRGLRFDTSVLQVDKKQFLDAEASKREFTPSEDRDPYATVGAHEGVWLFTNPIEVRPEDDYFIIEADVKGPASSRLFNAKVLIRGYQRVKAGEAGQHNSWFFVPHVGGPAYSEQFGKEQRAAQEGDFLVVFRMSLYCRLAKTDTWEHFRMGVKMPPTQRSHPEVILLKPYAMWPLGSYYFDNLVFRRVTKAEYDAAKAVGHSVKGFMPTK